MELVSIESEGKCGASNSLEVLLGVEPDYLPCFKGLVLAEFGPQTPTGGCWGAFPPTILAGGLQGGW